MISEWHLLLWCTMKKCPRCAIAHFRAHHHMRQRVRVYQSLFPTVDSCAAQFLLWSTSDGIGKKKNILIVWEHNFSSTRSFWSLCSKTKDNFVRAIQNELSARLSLWSPEYTSALCFPGAKGGQLQIVEYVTSKAASSLNFTFFLFLVQPENKNISSNTYPVIWMTSWTQWVIIFSLYYQLPI